MGRNIIKSKKTSSLAAKLFTTALCMAAVVLFLRPMLDTLGKPEPLADPVSLNKLEKGMTLGVPNDETFGEFLGTKYAALPPLMQPLSDFEVLGVSANDKRLEVDLTNQRVYAFEGSTKVYEFIVSTGKWGRTPTGTFTIWSKVRSQKMSGGSKENNTYYYLPNVPYVMFFSNSAVPKHRGFSFHGTYWHSNFGHPMSHGCVNMRTEDAATLFTWATPVIQNEKAWSTLSTQDNPGTQVTIYGVTPKS